MALRKYLISHFFVFAFCYGQPHIEVVLQNVLVNDEPYIVFNIIYHNTSQDTLVTYVQNWRAIYVDRKSQSIFGFPFLPHLTNRFFFVEDGIDLKSRIGRIEDNFMGKIVSNSFAIIKPKDSLSISIIFNDSGLVKQYDHEKIDLYFLMNWSTYSLFKSIVPKDILYSICLHKNVIIIPNLPIDMGDKWNTVMIRNSLIDREEPKLKPNDEEKLITELTEIFQTFLFHSSFGRQ